jgi:hypothetical protein
MPHVAAATAAMGLDHGKPSQIINALTAWTAVNRGEHRIRLGMFEKHPAFIQNDFPR